MTNSQRLEIERHLENMLLNLRHQSFTAPEEASSCADDNEHA